MPTLRRTHMLWGLGLLQILVKAISSGNLSNYFSIKNKNSTLWICKGWHLFSQVWVKCLDLLLWEISKCRFPLLSSQVFNFPLKRDTWFKLAALSVVPSVIILFLNIHLDCMQIRSENPPTLKRLYKKNLLRWLLRDVKRFMCSGVTWTSIMNFWSKNVMFQFI